MSNDQTTRSRRRFVKAGLAGVVGLQLGGASHRAAAAERPRLDGTDPTAKALAYVHDASALDDAARGGAGRICKTCRFFTDATASWGPCSLFPGKAVAGEGRCKGWVAKS